jgi:hypothetical protein
MKVTLTTLNDIEKARDALPSVVRRTPIVPLAPEPCEIGHEKLFLKAECLQITGAYKVRAAFNVIRSLSDLKTFCLEKQFLMANITRLRCQRHNWSSSHHRRQRIPRLLNIIQSCQSYFHLRENTLLPSLCQYSDPTR